MLVRDGTYENGILSIENGFVNDIPIQNGFGITRKRGGFVGIAGGDGTTNVNGVTIGPAGTRFEYPSSTGNGVVVQVSPGGARIEVNDQVYDLGSDREGKKVEIEPDGTILLQSGATVVHYTHSGHQNV